mgnify:CR=1 FL=1
MAPTFAYALSMARERRPTLVPPGMDGPLDLLDPGRGQAPLERRVHPAHLTPTLPPQRVPFVVEEAPAAAPLHEHLLLLAAVVLFLGGLAILVGYRTREAAWVLAAFTLVAGFLFHFQPADQMQMISFMKNIAITGGFLALGQIGAGALSLDARRGAAKPAFA